jgi:dephospho-CoA kinase
MALPLIAQAFGADLIDAQGALNRVRMRELVFADPSARQRLEAILHPDRRADRQQHEAAVAAGSNSSCTTFRCWSSPATGEARLDGVLVVDCRESTQTERVMARSALTREAVQAIIDAQATRTQRLAAADWVIYNDDGSQSKLSTHIPIKSLHGSGYDAGHGLACACDRRMHVDR